MATALLRVLVSQGLVSGYLSRTPRNIVRYPPGKTAGTWISVNRKSLLFCQQPPWCTGSQGHTEHCSKLKTWALSTKAMV